MSGPRAAANSLRILSGRAKGKRLALPPNPDFRPTSERAREQLFARVERWMRRADGRSGLRGAAVLDAFAGSGALGLEAWSRGAEALTWFEHAPTQAKRLAAQLAPYGKVLHADALHPPAGNAQDLVLLDPPYAAAAHAAAAQALAASGWLGPESLLVCEAPKGAKLDLQNLVQIDHFTLASSSFSFWQASGAPR